MIRSLELETWLRQNRAAVVAGNHTIPNSFLSGGSPVDFQWSLGSRLADDPELLRNFAVNTCNGCHGNETNTAFTHVKPRAANAPAQVSAFLSDEITGNLEGNRKDKFLATLCSTQP